MPMALSNYQKATSQAIDLAPGTIRELARESGIHQAMLSRIRQGERNPTDETMKKIEKALRAYAERSAKAANIIRAAIQQERE